MGTGSNSVAITQDVTVTGIAQITPPTVGGYATIAGHISLDNTNSNLVVGYKVIDDVYGGGIDIVDVSSSIGNVLDNLQSYGTQSYDVQEVCYSATEEAAYVAGADLTGASALKLDISSPSSVTLDAYVKLGGNVAKSIDHSVDYSSGSSQHVWVVNDQDTLYQFDPNLTGVHKITASSGTEFRSVVFNQLNDDGDSQVVAMDREASIHSENHLNVSDDGSFSTTSSINSNVEVGELAISRLQSSSDGNGALVAAFGDEGFSIVKSPGADTDPGTVLWNSKDHFFGGYYVSASYSHDYIYAARGDGSIQVFDIESSGSGGGYTLNSVEWLGTFDLSEITNSGVSAGDTQVNEIHTATVAGTNYIFVAAGQDGLIILEATY